MDDVVQFGRELHVITFSEAVKRGLLVDYKVIVLSVEETHVSRRIQNLLKDENNQLKVDDAAKIIGCWKALAAGLDRRDTSNGDHEKAIRRAWLSPGHRGFKRARRHTKSLKEHRQYVPGRGRRRTSRTRTTMPHTSVCEAEHVDGGMNAPVKAKARLAQGADGGRPCRILSNVRCLSERVDVPARQCYSSPAQPRRWMWCSRSAA